LDFRGYWISIPLILDMLLCILGFHNRNGFICGGGEPLPPKYGHEAGIMVKYFMRVYGMKSNVFPMSYLEPCFLLSNPKFDIPLPQGCTTRGPDPAPGCIVSGPRSRLRNTEDFSRIDRDFMNEFQLDRIIKNYSTYYNPKQLRWQYYQTTSNRKPI